MNTTLLPQAGLALLEAAINTALIMDPETKARLAALEGKVIAIDLQGLDVNIFFLPGEHGFRLMGHYEGEPDTCLRGRPLALLRLKQARAGEGLFSGDVQITGDIELGQRIQRILGGLDIDWEEHLSRLTGDVLAHQIGNGVRGLLHWGQQTMSNLQASLVDYAQYERRDLPVSWEVDEFLADVDELRSAVDRLTARLVRLEQKFKKQKG
ncbi:MAG: SCP2 sterol-binding domain-containing protein [Thiohalomonadaceae bacterium]